MSEKTNIEWASHTASPWFGCSKVSPGCTNCYAEQLTLQKKWAGWGDNSPRVRSKGFWKDAYRLDRKAGIDKAVHDNKGCHFDRPRMFTSLMDWLDTKAPLEWFTDFLQVIMECKNLNWLLLTKRPELWRERMHKAVATARPPSIRYKAYQEMLQWFNGTPPVNVWFGVTVENQEQLVKRWDALRNIPARIKWASVEPLLEYVMMHGDYNNRIYNYLGHGGFNWVVVGGESGPNRRDCGIVAIESIARQCREAGVPCFVKQDVGLRPGNQGRISDVIWQIKEYPKCQ